MPNLQLSIVIPCFNPSGKWLEHLAENVAFLNAADIAFELILVNDGSTKPLPENLQQQLDALCKNTFISYEQNMGKGFAVRAGVQHAKADVVVYTDIDFPYRKEDLLTVFEKVKAGSDVVIGIRSKSYYHTLPTTRVLISKFLRFLISFMMRIPTDDTQCGLKGFNEAGKNVLLKGKINRYLFDMEFVKLAAKNKLKIETTVVHLRAGVTMAEMPLALLFKEAVNFLRILLM